MFPCVIFVRVGTNDLSVDCKEVKSESSPPDPFGKTKKEDRYSMSSKMLDAM